MQPIDIAAIERQARALRAAEIQRISGLFAERTGLLVRLAAGSALAGLLSLSEVLHPLFAWNPQQPSAPRANRGGPLLTRLNRAARSLFAWNPQSRRAC